MYRGLFGRLLASQFQETSTELLLIHLTAAVMALSHASTTVPMTEAESGFREELVQLGGELFDGHTDHQTYERRVRRLQSKYDINPSETHGDYNFDFQFDDIVPAHNLQLHLSCDDSNSADAIKHAPHIVTTKDNSLHAAEILPTEDITQVSKSWDAVASVEAFIKEWTPFTLVASYFIFSTCLYMICNGELISIFWFIYLTTNFYIAGSTVIEAIMSMSPCRDARRALRKIQENDWIFPTLEGELPLLDLVTVAYLPNEKVSSRED